MKQVQAVEIMLNLLILLLWLFDAAHCKPMPVNVSDKVEAKIPMLPSGKPHAAPLNPEDITLFTTMFLNLFKGIADWRNVVAAETVQSVWQSPPVVDFSHRLFAKNAF